MDRPSPNIVYLLTSLLLLYKMVEGILCLSPCRQLRGVLSLGGPPGAGGVGGPAPATLPRPPAQHRPRQGAEVAESELHLRVTGPASSSCHGVSWHVTACHASWRAVHAGMLTGPRLLDDCLTGGAATGQGSTSLAAILQIYSIWNIFAPEPTLWWLHAGY